MQNVCVIKMIRKWEAALYEWYSNVIINSWTFEIIHKVLNLLFEKVELMKCWWFQKDKSDCFLVWNHFWHTWVDTSRPHCRVFFYTLPREPGMSTLNRPHYRKLRPTALSPSIISIIHTNTRPQDVFTLALSSSVRKSSVMLPAVFCLVFVHDNMTRIFNHCTSVVYLLNQSINIHNFSN